MALITLNVVRGDTQTGMRTERFEVPYKEGMSLLDAILWLREFKDPSIAVRYSCRSANACRECMAVVDNKAGYLCSIRAIADSEVHISPVSGLPWIKDLVTSID
ncbi:hypothetical protein B1748_08445 [Paenibacillus sp. MY03]|uniref:2Fe-2S iron-sulfur cluster-binding protein n=1 Tax=Paenibacillus sp. MY03 TaxID=302980 RepID=UPI000B3BE8AA|nr:2Fe-2S iron-sulfur cluster-binding protein [Paenibacillus sp. MY03]OUS77169.1 hypothetical protein B1748_08445 [Paenibacillus sp. MY03]